MGVHRPEVSARKRGGARGFSVRASAPSTGRQQLGLGLYSASFSPRGSGGRRGIRAPRWVPMPGAALPHISLTPAPPLTSHPQALWFTCQVDITRHPPPHPQKALFSASCLPNGSISAPGEGVNVGPPLLKTRMGWEAELGLTVAPRLLWP